MINRQMKKAEILYPSKEVDDFGYSEEYTTLKNIDIAIMLYNQTNTNDVRFKDVEYIGLSECKDLDDSMIIRQDNKQYKIMLVNITKRLGQYFLKVVN